MGTNWDMPPAQESPEAQYKKALEEGLELAKSWNADLPEGIKEDSPEASEWRADIQKKMNTALMKRLELLRAEPGFQTIEDADPDVRLSPEQKKAVEEYAALEEEGIRLSVQDMHGKKIDRNRLHEVRQRIRELEPQVDIKDLTAEEDERFEKATEQLARAQGYDIDPRGGQFIKGDLTIQVNNSHRPATEAIGGTTRIYRMEAWKGEGRNMENLFSYDRGYDVACEDEEAQKEIDKFVAMLG
jgi:cell fate (sporulation/competence/biofilm development) regulator YlbF (YheA/YmcA/DUF963 family)